MPQKLRPKLSYANVVSTICLFIVLGGSAYAASQLPKNSVGTKQLKNKAVTGAKVKDGSLTGVDINASTLGTVPKATSADTAGSASSATKAGDADKLGGAGAASYLQRAEAIPAGGTVNGTYGSPQVAGAEAWHEIGSPGNPSFSTSGACTASLCWQNFGGGGTTAAFFRDPFGVVHLKGQVKNVSNGLPSNTFQMFALPVGFRPAETWIFTAHSLLITTAPAVGAVAVGNTGSVFNANSNPLPNGAMISLDGISFRCAPSGAAGCP